MKHPDQKLLSNYALGAQDLTMRLLVETHLEHCNECESKIKKIRDTTTEIETASNDEFEVPNHLYSEILNQNWKVAKI